MCVIGRSRPGVKYHAARRSLARPIWGTGGRSFKSCLPEIQLCRDYGGPTAIGIGGPKPVGKVVFGPVMTLIGATLPFAPDAYSVIDH